MIRRFELEANIWIELRESRGKILEARTNYMPRWHRHALFNSIVLAANSLVTYGWEEVTQSLPPDSFSSKSGFDPNDLQAQDASLWNVKPCCGGGTNGGMYNKGAWHDIDCDTLKTPPAQSYLPAGYMAPAIPQPTNLGRCTCGSSSVGSDRHSDYCDLYRK